MLVTARREAGIIFPMAAAKSPLEIRKSSGLIESRSSEKYTCGYVRRRDINADSAQRAYIWHG